MPGVLVVSPPPVLATCGVRPVLPWKAWPFRHRGLEVRGRED